MLAAVKNVPQGPGDWALWTWNYQDAVHTIDQRLASFGISIPQYQLDPLPGNDVDNWLARIQQSHNDFNAALGNQGNDLSSVDITQQRELDAWVNLVYLELYDACVELGIGP